MANVSMRSGAKLEGPAVAAAMDLLASMTLGFATGLTMVAEEG
jgi:hypothetical protein